MKILAPLRTLGFGEARMHLMHTLFNGTTQGALRIRVHGELELATLRAALDVVRRRHEMLNVVIAEGEDALFFVSSCDVGAPPVSERWGETESVWLDLLQRENETILDPLKQLWRIVVFRYGESPGVFDLVVVMHHAVMDAQGADTLLHEVLCELTGEATCMEATSLPPAAESACSLTMDWTSWLQMQAALTRETLAGNPLVHAATVPILARNTVVQAFELEAGQTANVLSHCELHAVSLNSFVSAALLAAVREASPDRSRIALFTAVSLRRLCPAIEDRDFGCYLSVVPTFHSFDQGETSLRSLAKEHQESLRTSFIRFARPPADYALGDLRQGMERLASIDRFVNDIGFTYAESRLQTSYGLLQILKSHVIARRSLGNVALILHGLRLGNEIGFTVSYTSPLIDSAWVDQVVRGLRTRLASTEVVK